MSKAVAKFVSVVATHFPPPKFESEAQESEWLRSIVQSLGIYDEETLERGAQRIIETRGLRREENWFPKVAEIRKVMDGLIVEDRRRQTLPFDEHRPRAFVHKRALALDLLRTEQGRSAAADGWVLGLYEWIAEHGRAPTNQERHSFKTVEKGLDGKLRWTTVRLTEVEWLKYAARGAQDAYEEAIRGGFPFAAQFVALGDERAARRERLEQYVRGEIDLRGRASI